MYIFVVIRYFLLISLCHFLAPFRKRILQMLMSDPSKTVEIVNELNNCEIEIRMIKDELDAQPNGRSGAMLRSKFTPLSIANVLISSLLFSKAK